jgi:glycerol-3-phosphate cytidylyltransferase|tara:strand:+ start:1161 stop:1574 length:414 start_codon:yes stop_codon:yes gene_type:complete
MKIGVIAGNFDIIHMGYIHMFNDCKNYCDKLLVLLHEDPSIERPHKLKPIHTLEERKLLLYSLRQVDGIMPYRLESDLMHILKTVEIHVRFLGTDYIDKSFTGDELDIPIQYIDRSHGWSTTKYKTLISDSFTFSKK